MTAFAIGVYVAALLVANLTVAAFGPAVAPINAFLLIGLDLSLRDWLHTRLSRRQMLAVVAGSGAVTYLLNPAAGQIAVASVAAFSCAALVDWAVFARLRPKASWQVASHYSNGAGALVDSAVFLLAAPFPFSWPVFAMMSTAKFAGGAAWTLALRRWVQAPPAKGR